MTRFSEIPSTGRAAATDRPDDGFSELERNEGYAEELAGRATTIEALRHQNELLRQTIVLCDRLTGMALRGDGIASITAQFSQMIGHGVVVLDPMLSPLASAGWDRDRSGTADPLGLTITYTRLRTVLAGARGPLRLPAVPSARGTDARGTDVRGTDARGTDARDTDVRGTDVRGLGGCVIAPINLGSRLLGYVAVSSPEESVAGDLDLFAVQHAATVYAQALLEEDRVGAFRLRFRREIFEALLRGHESGNDPVESARLIGLDPDQAYQVLAISAGEPASPEQGPGAAGRGLVLETVVNALNHRWPDLVAVIQDEELIVVAPPHLPSTAPAGSPSEKAADELGASLFSFLESRFPATEFTVGASRVTTTLSQLATARDQARATLKLARRLGRTDAVTGYEALGFYRLLLAVPSPELRQFTDEVLGPLVDYDEAHGSDLVSTLAVYLRAGGSPRHAAEKLFVHPNTVVYRVGRIQSLIAVDLADPEDRLLCLAAVKGREALESRHAANGPTGAAREDRK